jgi:N-6 DNA Methylase
MTESLQAYLTELWRIRASGVGVPETSYYPPLHQLLGSIGHGLKPKVFCIQHPKDKGAGLPDFGLYTAAQLPKLKLSGSMSAAAPERGAVEAKPAARDVDEVAGTEQVERYRKLYGLVLVTNYWDFLLIGTDRDGGRQEFERFRLAPSDEAFWDLAAHPVKAGRDLGPRFHEFLSRVLLHKAPLTQPKDLAWFLASYARDALARVDAAGDLPALAAVRDSLEQALGFKFEGEKGDHFFRSTLVQTLFYGVFSTWVLWSRQQKSGSSKPFDWHAAAWSLHVPMIRTLFGAIATPDRLLPLGLVEVLNWTAGVLNRVDRTAFFKNFDEGQAVQYFYEPFLEAFDPALRKDLGVWYTPPEIVRYMVERVDRVLRQELGLADGLADRRVVVLDPCCGTGSYLVEVLRRIAHTLEERGEGATLGAEVRRAAQERVFGFEIMPAPYVIAHWQIGLMLSQLGAPLADGSDDRAGIYLTNSLTGWEPPSGPKCRFGKKLSLWNRL